MIVIRVCMWPGGDASREEVIGTATLACLGEAQRDQGAVSKGERAYRVRLMRDKEFGGPDGRNANAIRYGPVWKQAVVRGHQPGPRGVWDLVGGALKVVLERRLSRYHRVTIARRKHTPGAIDDARSPSRSTQRVIDSLTPKERRVLETRFRKAGREDIQVDDKDQQSAD